MPLSRELKEAMETRYQPTFTDAVKLVRYQLKQLNLDITERWAEADTVSALAGAWYDQTPGPVFRQALVGAGIILQ